MQNRKYEFLLAIVIAARATSFIFSKMTLGSIGTFNLLAVRFILAFALLAILFWKRLTDISFRDLASGILCGTIFFLVMTCEYTALKTSGSGMVSLLENCSIIFVPFFEALLLHRLPGKLAVISALTAIMGAFCITVQNGGLSGGVIFGLLAAVFYAAGIIVTGIVSRKAKDTLCIGIVQVGALGVLALAASWLFETPHMPTQTSQWLMILALSVICTCFGYTLQPIAQRYVSTERAGLLCAISPAIAAILGAVVLHEQLGALSVLGLFLILFSINFPYIKISRICNLEEK
ncbi:MAG: DMT family transporter [Oscillospiraceae bacterium]|nr:DMT family transporter [Oscillospiraceae bacterium]